MKRVPVAVASALCMVGAVAWGQMQAGGGGGVGLMVRGGGVAPESDDEWDMGAAFDAGVILWGSPNVGLWLGGGAQDWPAAEESLGLGGGAWFTIDGRATVAPFGGSLLLWGDLGNGLALQAEGGLRYAVVDSNVDVEVGVPYSAGYSMVYEAPLEIDDTAFAVATLQLEFATDFWSLGIGGGYQWDLMKPEQTLLGESVGETDFSAALFFASLSLSF